MINTVLLLIILAILIYIFGRRRLFMLDSRVKNVTADEANELILNNKDVIILDVRTKGEYSAGHIPGAKLMPSVELALRINEIEKYVDKPVLVYCASGGRSPGAVQTLIRNNFSNVYHLTRGISSWRYKVER